MTKEQKQYALLGVIAGIFAAYCVVNFVASPLWSKWRSAQAEYEDLSAKLEDAGRLMANQGAIHSNLTTSRQVIADALAEHIPDLENPLSWATEKIYNLAREIGLDVESVSETGASMVLQVQGENRYREFNSYAVRIVVDCSYEETKLLVQSLELSNPYLCVSAVKIDAKPTTPETHTVNLTVEWPIWSDPAAAGKVLNVEESADA